MRASGNHSDGKKESKLNEPGGALDAKTSSSIFSSTPFIIKGKSQQFGQLESEKQTLNFIENMLENQEENVQLKIKKEELHCSPEETLMLNNVNAMTLFAYQSEEADKNFASAFITSAKGNNAAHSNAKQPVRNPNRPSSPNSGSLANQPESMSQDKSAKSKSSNGSSLTEEIFNNIPSSFQEQASPEGPKGEVTHSKRSGSSSTQGSSEIHMVPQMETMQGLCSSLPVEDQQILQRLEYYLFDQAGCRMLQSKINPPNTDATTKLHESPFYKCLVHCLIPYLADVMVNQFGNYLCQKIMEIADPVTLSIMVN